MTVRDTINRAIGMTGARSLGDTPSSEEMAAGLQELQDMLLALPRTVLTDVYTTTDYTAGENERITGDGTLTITIPDTITDTKTGELRAPRNGAVVWVTNGPKYIYITEMQSWNRYDALALTDDQPFGPEHEQGVAAMLAVRMGEPVFQRSPSQVVVALAQEGRRAIRQRFRQLFTATTDPLLLNVFQRNGTNLQL